MEIGQLRYFVAVVDHGSFTAAAQRLHVSQSGISAQLAKLERELGHDLLVRGPRTIRLTHAGETLLPRAREAIRAVEGVRQSADELRDLIRGRVRLGMIAGCTIPGFLDAVAAFHQEHPGVTVELVEDTSDRLQRRTLAGELDLGLISHAGPVIDGLATESVSNEQLAVITPPGHRLAGGQPRLADLHEETVLCIPPGTGIRTAFEQSCARADVEPKVDLSGSNPETLLGLTARGLGVCVLAGSMAGGTDLVATPIVDAEVRAGLALVIRDGDQQRATRRLYDLLRAALT
ncbi:LysR family transcriptional regulator [Nocardioides albus]|uniref:DNA-binding transcriptional LysR family regulator n=1 Tax=Nocardioides albus TaxID=1841 RepID=A0A7W5A4B3_9ACTN|nr:LysR family transcriptional regulator [Nocardioides albus]MBB3089223.1 DNA-binding transcriptional LysR family regulator [Nocardioides albus]GGU13430.1 LysR family transcriptional regulator [Nocardioides albus]